MSYLTPGILISNPYPISLFRCLDIYYLYHIPTLESIPHTGNFQQIRNHIHYSNSAYTIHILYIYIIYIKYIIYYIPMYTHFRKKNVLDKFLFSETFPKFFLYRSPGIAECFEKWMECRPQVISRTLLVSGPPARFRDCPLLCVRESQTNAVQTRCISSNDTGKI